MEGCNYDAVSTTIKFEDITSSETNQGILRRLKENDIDKLWICDEETTDGDTRDYVPLDENDMGWLGYFIGNSTSLKEIIFLTRDINNIEAFCRGLNNNQSIMRIGFLNIRGNPFLNIRGTNRLEGNIFGMLDPFFTNNHKLTKFEVRDCELGAEGVRLLSLAIRTCKSLKHFTFSYSEIGDGQMVDIILALSVHTQLEKIVLSRMNIGRNECTALATLLRNTIKHLQTLNLVWNNIDDDGVETLVNAMDGSQLRDLNLSSNATITNEGWKTVSALLERPGSNLEKLYLSRNNIGDEGALILANALRGNCELKTLALHDYSGITAEGWTPFLKLLCDTSNVNCTYLSNHTLGNVGYFAPGASPPDDIQLHLSLNNSIGDKGRIAMTKILQHHSHFDMQPLFEWELKVLPLVIDWLEKAAACTTEFDDQIKRMKLSCMYDFVREFPMLYVEPVTRKEIEKYSAMEMKMEGDPMQHDKLEEVQQRKTRAMRRLF